MHNTIINNYIDNAIVSIKKSINNINLNLSYIQCNRINESIFNKVKIDYYNSKVSINKISKINILNNKVINIEPWEKKFLKAIETSIINSNLGFNPQNNGNFITINIPIITFEKRKYLVKEVKNIIELGKINIRNIRNNVNNKIKDLKKDNISKDEIKLGENNLQKIYFENINYINKIMEQKVNDIIKG